MNVYTVYEPPVPPADRFDRAESLVFVKEGFTWVAAALTPLWLIFNRMWLVLAAYLAGTVAVQLALFSANASEGAASLVMTAAHLIIGLEADALRRWTLERNGWRMIGSVTGRNWADCERRFFSAWLPGEPYIRADALSGHGGALPLSGGISRAGKWRFGTPFARKS
jgi:hypothetical protein